MESTTETMVASLTDVSSTATPFPGRLLFFSHAIAIDHWPHAQDGVIRWIFTVPSRVLKDDITLSAYDIDLVATPNGTTPG